MDNVVKIMHLEESHLHELVPYFADYSELSIETKEQFNQVKVILDRIMYQDLLQIEVLFWKQQLAGFIGWEKCFSFTNGKLAIRIQALYIAPWARRNGLAKKLLEHIYEMAESLQVVYIRLETEEYNCLARRLYEKDGYKHLSNKVVYIKPI